MTPIPVEQLAGADASPDLPEVTPAPSSRVQVITLLPTATQTPIDLPSLRAARAADFEQRMAELLDEEGSLP